MVNFRVKHIPRPGSRPASDWTPRSSSCVSWSRLFSRQTSSVALSSTPLPPSPTVCGADEIGAVAAGRAAFSSSISKPLVGEGGEQQPASVQVVNQPGPGPSPTTTIPCLHDSHCPQKLFHRRPQTSRQTAALQSQSHLWKRDLRACMHRQSTAMPRSAIRSPHRNSTHHRSTSLGVQALARPAHPGSALSPEWRIPPSPRASSQAASRPLF